MWHTKKHCFVCGKLSRDTFVEQDLARLPWQPKILWVQRHWWLLCSTSNLAMLRQDDQMFECQNIASYLHSMVWTLPFLEGNGNPEPSMKRAKSIQKTVLSPKTHISSENWCLEDKPFVLKWSLFRRRAVHFFAGMPVCLFFKGEPIGKSLRKKMFVLFSNQPYGGMY